jgi:hypothetical protein
MTFTKVTLLLTFVLTVTFNDLLAFKLQVNVIKINFLLSVFCKNRFVLGQIWNFAEISQLLTNKYGEISPIFHITSIIYVYFNGKYKVYFNMIRGRILHSYRSKIFPLIIKTQHIPSIKIDTKYGTWYSSEIFQYAISYCEISAKFSIHPCTGNCF